jgi:serine/threonine protein kinase, bacterial
MTSQLLNDRYQIIRTLGSGGFGDTFLAEDTHMPSRRLCVVKRLRPVQANPQVNQLVQDRAVVIVKSPSSMRTSTVPQINSFT